MMNIEEFEERRGGGADVGGGDGVADSWSPTGFTPTSGYASPFVSRGVGGAGPPMRQGEGGGRPRSVHPAAADGDDVALATLGPSLPDTFSVQSPEELEKLRAAALRSGTRLAKLHFANERTLLQWLNATLLLGLSAATLLNFGLGIGQFVGLSLTAACAGFLVYALWLYERRRRALMTRDADYDFDAPVGATIFAIVFVVCFTTILITAAVVGVPEDPSRVKWLVQV
jgi:uncharacterized membrane protein YidH (DUF202 family)